MPSRSWFLLPTFFVLVSATQAAVSFTVSPIASLDNNIRHGARSSNGKIVVNMNNLGYVYDRTTGFTPMNINMQGFPAFGVKSVSASGQVLGQLFGGGNTREFYWDQAGGQRSDFGRVDITAINDHNEIAGYEAVDGIGYGVKYTNFVKTFVNVPGLEAYRYVSFFDIRNDGTVIGTHGNGPDQQAFMYGPTGLVTRYWYGMDSWISDYNIHGDLVGHVSLGQFGGFHHCVIEVDGTNVLGQNVHGEMLSINDKRNAVGFFSSGSLRATFWRPQDGHFDLRTMIPDYPDYDFHRAYALHEDDSFLIYGVNRITNKGMIFEAQAIDADVVHPTAYSVVQGWILGGSVGNLKESDDVSLQLTTNTFGIQMSTKLVIDIEGVLPIPTTESFKFEMEARSAFPSANGQKVELYDFVAGNWIKVDERASMLTDSMVTVQVNNASRFIQPGTRKVKARLTFAGGQGSVSRIAIDRAIWRI